MNVEEDFASDTDQSDDDFCPDAENSAPGSEEESEDISAEEDNAESPAKAVKTKKTANKRVRRSKTKRKNKSAADEESADEAITTTDQRRQTRQTEECNGNGTGKGIHEKDEIQSDEEDKSRSDALWADFLSDVKQPEVTKSQTSSSSKTPVKNAASSNGEKQKTPEEKEKVKQTEEKRSIVVTEVVDFAGEAVSIQKTVPAESIKENKVVARKPNMSPLLAAQKRPASVGAGGLGSILGQIGKKKKISVLEKSKLDWNSFKQDEGIEEQLQTHNKGKDGYLERQDFLQRTDLRQFEIEKSLRQTRRTQ